MARRSPKIRFIPVGSKEKTYKTIPGVVVYLCKDGISAIGYSGKSTRSDFYFKFQSAVRRDEYIKEYFDKKKKELTEKEARTKLVSEFRHELVVGDVIYHSWGYDQTNIDFYEVVAVPSGKTVKIRAIASKIVSGSHFEMSGQVVAVAGQFTSEDVLLKKVKPGYRSAAKEDLIIHFQCGIGCVWNGKPKSFTSYA